MSQHYDEPDPNGLDDRFADWVDGRLEEQARQELEAELARDPELRRQAEEYRATVRMLREHLAEESDPPADMVTGLLERARRERSPAFRLLPMVLSLSAAAALVLVMFLLNQPGPDGPAPSTELAKTEADSEAEAESEARDDKARPEDAEELAKAERSGKSEGVAGERPDLDMEKQALEHRERLAREPAPTREPTKAMDPPRLGAGAGQRQGARRSRAGAGESGADRQLDELRRIAAQVFADGPETRKTAPDEVGQDVLDLELAPDARKTGKKSQADGRKEQARRRAGAGQGAQLPVLVVQVAAPTAGGRLRATNKNNRDSKDKTSQEDRTRPQVPRGFLDYLQQQPQSWAVGNRIFHQARASDVTSLATRGTPRVDAAPRTKAMGGAGAAAAEAVPQPGDQLLLVRGRPREVEVLFQQLKTFLGRTRQEVVVQQLAPDRFSGGAAAFAAPTPGGENKEAGRVPAGEEMRFLLLLRPAPAAGRPGRR